MASNHRNQRPTLAEVQAAAAPHVQAIHRFFTPDSKILVLVVFPEKPDQNWLLGDATIDEAIAGLQWLRQYDPASNPGAEDIPHGC